MRMLLMRQTLRIKNAALATTTVRNSLSNWSSSTDNPPKPRYARPNIAPTLANKGLRTWQRFNNTNGPNTGQDQTPPWTRTETRNTPTMAVSHAVNSYCAPRSALHLCSNGSGSGCSGRSAVWFGLADRGAGAAEPHGWPAHKSLGRPVSPPARKLAQVDLGGCRTRRQRRPQMDAGAHRLDGRRAGRRRPSRPRQPSSLC